MYRNKFDIIDPETWKAARRALERAVVLYIQNPDVSLIDLGFKVNSIQNADIEPELAVRIHLHQHLSKDQIKQFLSQELKMASERIGFATELAPASYPLSHKVKQRDSRAYRNSGIGLYNPTAKRQGTIGGLVRDRQTGQKFILTNWHVLAGGAYLQPGNSQSEASKKSDKIPVVRNALSARLDAAIGTLRKEHEKIYECSNPGEIAGIAVPRPGMRVMKRGDGEDVTTGIITGVFGYSVYSIQGKNHLIGPLIHIHSENPDEELCASGDSGVWWLEQQTQKAVGMHFTGIKNRKSGLALSMPDILEALDVYLVVEKKPMQRIQPSATVMPCTNKKIEPPELSEMELHYFDEHHFQKMQVLKLNENQIMHTNSLEDVMIGANTHNRLNNIAAISQKLLQIFLIVVTIFVTLSFHSQSSRTKHQQQEVIGKLQYKLSELGRIVAVEREHDKSIQKILKIIELYNPDMVYDLKMDIAEEIYEMTLQYNNLNIELICATITHESALTWDPEVVSPAGALGLMQIIPVTGYNLATQEGIPWDSAEVVLFNPIYNIRLGCRYLSSLIKAYSVDGGLAAYNGGERRAELWIRKGRVQGILHEETAFYVPSILRIYETFKQITI